MEHELHHVTEMISEATPAITEAVATATKPTVTLPRGGAIALGVGGAAGVGTLICVGIKYAKAFFKGGISACKEQEAAKKNKKKVKAKKAKPELEVEEEEEETKDDEVVDIE